MNENQLLHKAIDYIKQQYDEDTVRMTMLKNNTTDGSGIIEVECTVRTGDSVSDWNKWFTFENGAIVAMRWEQLRQLKND